MTGLKKLLMWKAASGGGSASQTETVSGSLVTFETTKARPLQECRVDFLPKQSGSGDPSPENVRPINGWDGCTVFRAGKNMLDTLQNNKAGQSSWTAANGSIGTTSVASGNATWVWFTQVFPAGEYTISCTHSGDGTTGPRLLCSSEIDGGSYVSVYNGWYKNFTAGSCTFVSNAPFSIGLVFLTNADHKFEPGTFYNIQLEPGSTATPYEPYTATSYPVTWQSAGTVYGGYVDLVRGVLVATHECITSTWGSFENKNVRGDNTRGRINTIHNAGSGGGTNSICNVAKKFWNYTDDTTHFYVDGMYAYLFLPNNTDENLEIQITYQLSDPITYSITPQQITTLIGTNNIWSDAGDVTVTYTK